MVVTDLRNEFEPNALDKIFAGNGRPHLRTKLLNRLYVLLPSSPFFQRSVYLVNIRLYMKPICLYFGVWPFHKGIFIILYSIILYNKCMRYCLIFIV